MSSGGMESRFVGEVRGVMVARDVGVSPGSSEGVISDIVVVDCTMRLREEMSALYLTCGEIKRLRS